MTINVLYVTHLGAFHGGAPRSLWELIGNIDRAKVTPFLAYTTDGELVNSIRKIGVQTLKISPFSRNPLSLLASTMRLIRFIGRRNIHIIHNNQCYDAYVSWLAGKLTQTPVVIHHRDPSVFKLGRFLINHTDCNIAISTWYNREILDDKGIVVMNAIELDRFPCSVKRDHGGPVRVVVLGRLEPKKGQHVFIEAAREIMSRGISLPLRFVIVGDWDSAHFPEYKACLYKLADRYRLEGLMEFRQWEHDVIKIYREMDICVVPSIKESFGRVIIEAMACCVPVVATNIGGALDVITAETGILVPVGVPQPLADAIIYLAERPLLREQMGLAGRAKVEQNFSVERMLRELYAVYSKVLNERKSCRFRARAGG